MESNNKRGKLRQPMTARRWTLSFVGTMAFIMLLIALINYIVDPYSYFHDSVTDDKGMYTYYWDINLRLAHYHYFKEHHQEYTGVILGGSKGNEDMALFRTLFDQVQETVNKMSGVLMKFRSKNPPVAEKLTEALLALSEKVKEAAEG